MLRIRNDDSNNPVSEKHVSDTCVVLLVITASTVHTAKVAQRPNYIGRTPPLARYSAPVQTGPGAHPASCAMGTRSFPGVKSGRGVTLTPHPFRCRGQERVELYLYSPYGPYGLYRALVPIQGCTLPFLLPHLLL